jgi:4-amino-4-deoxy-L-arabinose transferase-like glycosyltransferase
LSDRGRAADIGVTPAAPAASADDSRWLVRSAFLLTAGLLAARLLVIGQFGFFSDEAYYWVWSENLAFGYYDHPPMVALFIRIGTLLFGDTEFGVRFPGAVSAAADILLVYGIAFVLFQSRRIAAWAAIFANCTLLGVLSIITVPDQPMILFLLGGIYALARIARGGGGGWWLLTGAMFGLAAISKYTALFVAVAVPLWLALVPAVRPWLRNPWPYLGAALAVAIMFPVILWNVAEGWPSVTLQLSRGSDGAPLETFSLYVGLLPVAASPFIAILAVAGFVQCLRSGWRADPVRALLVLMPLPLLLYLAQHSLSEAIDPHWISPLVFLSAILAAVPLGRSMPPLRRMTQWIAVAAVAFGTLLAAGTYTVLAELWMPFSYINNYTSRFRGWAELSDSVAAKMAAEGAGYLVASDYNVVSLMRYHLRETGIRIYLVGDWGRDVFGVADPELAEETGLYLGRRTEPLERAAAESYFGDVVDAGQIARPVPDGPDVPIVTFRVGDPTPAAAPLFGEAAAGSGRGN